MSERHQARVRRALMSDRATVAMQRATKLAIERLRYRGTPLSSEAVIAVVTEALDHFDPERFSLTTDEATAKLEELAIEELGAVNDSVPVVGRSALLRFSSDLGGAGSNLYNLSPPGTQRAALFSRRQPKNPEVSGHER